MKASPTESVKNALMISNNLDTLAESHKKAGDYYYQQYKESRQGKNTLVYAINEYMKASELSDNPEILAQLCRCYFLNGQLEFGFKILEKLENASLPDPVKKSVSESRAFYHYRRGELSQSIQYLKQALKHSNPLMGSKLYFGLFSMHLEKTREKGSFINSLKAAMYGGLALSTVPFSKKWIPFLFYSKTLLFVLINRIHPRADLLPTYNKLHQMYPGYELIPLEIGKILAEQRQLEEAEFWFNQVIRRHPTKDEGYRCLANLYQIQQRHEDLVEVLNQWLAIRPNNAEIVTLLSRALADKPENYEQALALSKKALVLLKDPRLVASTYCHMGNLYAAMHQTEAAIVAYQASITCYPKHLDTYIQLGTLYYEQQDYSLSEKVFEKALGLSPDHAKIYCNLGYLSWMQGDIQKAQRYYHRSIELDPAYDIALNNLGVLYLDHIGDIGKAMDLFERTLSQTPDYALCHYNMGRAYSFLGKNIEAAKCFKRAQELNATSQELDNEELTDRIKYLFEFTTDLRERETPRDT